MRNVLGHRRAAAALLIGLALIGCGNGRPAERAATPADTVQPRVMSATPEDSLVLEVIVPPRIRKGETVPVTLRVRNPAARTVDVYLLGREPTMDVIVERDTGGRVWRRLEGDVIPAIALLRALGPGESLEIRTTWDQRTNAGRAVEPGRYRVRAVLLMEGRQRETDPATIEIVAPQL